MCCLLFVACGVGACRPEGGGPGTLETVRDVAEAAASSGALGQPVRLEAVVTYFDPDWNLLFVQDTTGGLYIAPGALSADLRPGQRVILRGASAPSHRGIRGLTVDVRGAGALPTPEEVAADGLRAVANEWVELEGTVLSTAMEDGRFTVVLDSGGRRLTVRVLEVDAIAPPTVLPDDPVRVQGVAAMEFDTKQRFVGMQLFVPDMRFVRGTEQGAGRSPRRSEAEGDPVERVVDLRRLSIEEAARGRPARLTGVVTYFDPVWDMLFLQDETGGIYVHVEAGDRGSLQSGRRVAVRGVTGAGDFAPVVAFARVEDVGQGTMPAEAVRDHDRIFTGAADAQWSELEGVVQEVRTDDAGHVLLEIASGAYRFTAYMPLGTDAAAPGELVDSRVRLRGVAGTRFNGRRQFVGVNLWVPSPVFVTVVTPAPAAPYDLPVRSIDQLLRYRPEGALGHMTRIRGVVTLARPSGDVYIQDASSGMLVRTRQQVTVAPGDSVDVVGFPAGESYTPSLRHALLRRTGEGAAPAAQPISAPDALSGRYDARLVRMDARVVDAVAVDGDHRLRLASEDLVFVASLPENEALTPAAVRPGSQLRLTGVLRVDVGDWRSGLEVSSVRLLLRGADDVAVLQAASWWGRRHTIGVVAALLVLITVTVGWVLTLRRRVRRQTDLIRRQLQQEAELRSAAAEAEAANRAKSLFLANMSHEIRTPLTSILGFSEVLSAEVTGPHADMARRVHAGGQRLLETLNAVLDLVEFETGKRALRPAPVDVAAHVRAVVEAFSNRAGRKGLTLVSVGTDDPVEVQTDPRALDQVLNNLVVNAIKFTEKGSISVSVEPEVGFVEIAVTDTGVGIEMGFIPHLFDAFSQESSGLARDFEGNGLGLSITKRLVEMMSAEILVESEKGAGATFRLRLPRRWAAMNGDS